MYPALFICRLHTLCYSVIQNWFHVNCLQWFEQDRLVKQTGNRFNCLFPLVSWGWICRIPLKWLRREANGICKLTCLLALLAIVLVASWHHWMSQLSSFPIPLFSLSSRDEQKGWAVFENYRLKRLLCKELSAALLIFGILSVLVLLLQEAFHPAASSHIFLHKILWKIYLNRLCLSSQAFPP